MARKYRFRKFQAGPPAHREVLSCIMSGRDDVPFRRTLPAPIRSVAYFRNRYFPAVSAVGGCTGSLRRKGAAIGGNFPCWPIGLRRGLPFRENRKGKARLRHRLQAQAGNGVANRGDSCRKPPCGRMFVLQEDAWDRQSVRRERVRSVSRDPGQVVRVGFRQDGSAGHLRRS